MFIKFFDSGRGGGKGPTDYCCNVQVPTIISVPDPKTGRLKAQVLRDDAGKPVLKIRTPPPEILAGDKNRTRVLIDSLDFKWRYSSGVIAFAPDDQPSDKQQKQLMAEFEALAFAGFDRERYDILWIRHSHEGTTELHFVIPRVDLNTGKSYNPAPPGWEHNFAPLRDAWNYEHGWARPDDPARARAIQPGHTRLQLAENARAGITEASDPKALMTDYLLACIEARLIHDRSGIIAALEELGMAINRQGQDYISVRLKPNAKPVRLKGLIYAQDFNGADFNRTVSTAKSTAQVADRAADADRSASARHDYEQVIVKRAEYNARRYATKQQAAGSVTENSTSSIITPNPPATGHGDQSMAEDDTDYCLDLDRHLHRQLGNEAILNQPYSIPSSEGRKSAIEPGDDRGQNQEDQFHRNQSVQNHPAAAWRYGQDGLDDHSKQITNDSIWAKVREDYERIRETVTAGIRTALATIRSGYDKARSAEQQAQRANDLLVETSRSIEHAHNAINALIEREIEESPNVVNLDDGDFRVGLNKWG